MYNVAFTCYLNLRQTEKCLDILLTTDRIPEAALFARTYLPSRVPELVAKWKTHLDDLGKHKAAESLADPSSNADLFSNYQNVSQFPMILTLKGQDLLLVDHMMTYICVYSY